MSGREAMLARIREALRVPSHHAPASTASMCEVLPAVEDGWEQLVVSFRDNAKQLKAEFVVEPSVEAAMQRIADLAREASWTKVLSHRGGPAEQVASALSLPVLWAEDRSDKHEAAQCEASVTGCEALVAQTGSVLVSAHSAGGRTPSVLPWHHVVVATRGQLVADLPAAFERIKDAGAGDTSSFYSLVTGPSRTGDIERVLVLGAHGPARLTIVLVDV